MKIAGIDYAIRKTGRRERLRVSYETQWETRKRKYDHSTHTSRLPYDLKPYGKILQDSTGRG